MRMIHKINKATGEWFDLADAEIHSVVLRNTKQKNADRFFKHLQNSEMDYITEAFYNSIQSHYMNCFAVIVDKRELYPNINQDYLHKRTYEFLLERIEQFLENYHQKQKGLIIMDNSGKKLNRSLALKHSHFLKNGSSSGLKFKHIVEMPMFVESNLSNGAQLADLCAYNCYHAIKYNKPDYSYFQKMLPSFYNSPKTNPEKFDGIKIFTEKSSRVQDVIREALDINKKTIELLKPDSLC